MDIPDFDQSMMKFVFMRASDWLEYLVLFDAILVMKYIHLPLIVMLGYYCGQFSVPYRISVVEVSRNHICNSAVPYLSALLFNIKYKINLITKCNIVQMIIVSSSSQRLASTGSLMVGHSLCVWEV